MTDRLLRKKEIAAILGTSPGVAASILSNMGVHPIDFGYGRSRGPRWLESAVTATLQAMHKEAQPVQKQAKKRQVNTRVPEINLATASVADVFALTSRQGVQ